MHDTQIKRPQHLNFFQYECFLEVRTPRVTLPDVQVVLVEPNWFTKLAGFTLLFEALVLAMARQMSFAAVAKLAGLSWYRIHAICSRYVDLVPSDADFSELTAVAIEETSSRRGHNYLTLAVDTDKRKIVFVTDRKDASTIARLAQDLAARKGAPEKVRSVSINMSPAFIKGVTCHLPNARITFDKFHAIAHACGAVPDAPPGAAYRSGPQGAALDAIQGPQVPCPRQAAPTSTGLIAQAATKRTARAMLSQWCSNVLRSKVEPMKDAARMIPKHLDGIVTWVQTRQNNGFIEALNGLFQAAKRKARGYTCLTTMRTLLFLIAGKLDFTCINPYAACPTQTSKEPVIFHYARIISVCSVR